MKDSHYFFNKFKVNPSKRGFFIFIRMLIIDFKCLLLTGRTIDEVIK